MKHYNQHPQFYDKPVCLSEEDKAAPQEVIRNFFQDYKLSELRQSLHDIKEVGMTCDLYPYDSGESRATLLLFCDRVEELLEAAFLIGLSE